MKPALCTLSIAIALFAPARACLFAADETGDIAKLAAQLRALEPNVIDVPGKITPEEREKLRRMLSDDVRDRLRAANRRETEAWRKITTREEWEKYRDEKIEALRRSLGRSWRTKSDSPDEVPRIRFRITRPLLTGEGHYIERLVFQSSTGLDVTANLYSADWNPPTMPGIIICPSHHNPKTQGELQDMGMMFARLGCHVVVIDNLGHGERRQHPFRTKDDYPDDFQVGRQDYYFRYNLGMQLHLAGESLIGWMAHDLCGAVDLLLSQPRIDRKKIILLGAVAGGGDPAGVAAALDPRIECVVPFNFGGPQPETRHPLPDDAEDSFNYAGSGGWESTRNLRLSARDGFLPWVIVGSVAPRCLIHAHEFAWDHERDPVWQRYQKIFGFYDAADKLSFTHGFGAVTGRPPEASHCNNIGPVQRKAIYPALNQWFEIVVPKDEYSKRREAEELLCLTGTPKRDDSRLSARIAADILAAQRATSANRESANQSPAERRAKLQQGWAGLLGELAVSEQSAILGPIEKQTLGDLRLVRMVARTEREIVVPVLLALPARPRDQKVPVVVGLAQGGKSGFLRERASVIAALLNAGVGVCLPDLRGTGETRPGDDRGRRSSATGISSSELMLGQTMVGSRLKDLRTVLLLIRSMPEIDARRIALWGDSFAPVNARDRNLQVPLDAAALPDQSEPLGHLLALLGGLFEEDIAVVASARGGLWGYQSVLESQFIYLPHDVIVPGARTIRDLNAIAASLAPRPLWMAGLVDGLNRRLTAEESGLKCEGIRHAYERAGGGENFAERQDIEPGKELADWLISQLKK